MFWSVPSPDIALLSAVGLPANPAQPHWEKYVMVSVDSLLGTVACLLYTSLCAVGTDLVFDPSSVGPPPGSQSSGRG